MTNSTDLFRHAETAARYDEHLSAAIAKCAISYRALEQFANERVADAQNEADAFNAAKRAGVLIEFPGNRRMVS